MKLYTSLGRYILRQEDSVKYPVVIVAEKEHLVSPQEMVLWSCSLWQIYTYEELHRSYCRQLELAGLCPEMPFEDCLQRLLTRGLLAEGCEHLKADALYGLLSNLFIVPLRESLFARCVAFVKLLWDGIPAERARQAFVRPCYNAREKETMRMALNQPLTTAELIRCEDLHVPAPCTEEEVIDALYADGYTTSANIASLSRHSPAQPEILNVVANLYLKKAVVLDRA